MFSRQGKNFILATLDLFNINYLKRNTPTIDRAPEAPTREYFLNLDLKLCIEHEYNNNIFLF